jgi:hypothetical protein
MKKILLIDRTKDGVGDEFVKEFNTIEAANKQAEIEWGYLTESEKEKRRIFVATVDAQEYEEGNGFSYFTNESTFDSESK